MYQQQNVRIKIFLDREKSCNLVTKEIFSVHPILLSILIYADPIFRTEGDQYSTYFHINVAPMPKYLTLDTYLNTTNFTLYTRLVLFYINFLLYGKSLCTFCTFELS